jgi:hypothetical protein
MAQRKHVKNFSDFIKEEEMFSEFSAQVVSVIDSKIDTSVAGYAMTSAPQCTGQQISMELSNQDSAIEVSVQCGGPSACLQEIFGEEAMQDIPQAGGAQDMETAEQAEDEEDQAAQAKLDDLLMATQSDSEYQSLFLDWLQSTDGSQFEVI